jgi:hypothetical protein
MLDAATELELERAVSPRIRWSSANGASMSLRCIAENHGAVRSIRITGLLRLVCSGTTDCRLRDVCLTKARPGSGLFFFSEGLRQSRTLDMQLVATPCARLAERVTIGRALSRYKMITPPRPNDGQPRQSASPSCPTREARPRHPFLQDVQRRGSGVTNRDFVERPFPLR